MIYYLYKGKVMELQIEKNIPLPPVNRGRQSKYDFVLQMQQGDSVLAPTQHVASALVARLRTVGYKAATRKVEGGIRVWRIQ
tara:strand:- start:4393 stop:4638 length:246 start_codon:yes stop_codon:yes gene_type:complete